MSVVSDDEPEGGTPGGNQMVRKQATNDEWRVYYERADQLRAAVGDPFKRHAEREALRERLLLIGSVVFVLATLGAFCLFTMR